MPVGAKANTVCCVMSATTEADLVPTEAYGGQERRLIQVLADLVAGGETRWAIKAKGRTAANVMTRDVTTVVDETGHVLGVVSRRDMLQVLHRSDDELRREIEAVLGDPRRDPDPKPY